MEFKNGYNLIYEKMTADGKALFASKSGIPTADDGEIDLGLTKEEIAAIKLVYENANGIVVSTDTIPSSEDKSIELTIDGEPVIGPSGDEPVPPEPLKPFIAGKTISGIIVDPTYFTIEQMDAVLTEIPEEILVSPRGGGDEIGTIVLQDDVDLRLLLILISDEDNVREDGL